jgi:hypothetical protein
MAMMLLCLCVSTSLSGCLLPQDDALILPLPDRANRPLRVLVTQSTPPIREVAVRANRACDTFSVAVDDPDLGDTIRATWFIDPNERYVASVNEPVIPGNPVAGTGGSTVRKLEAPSQFYVQLSRFIDGQKHRVEVVVTDGEFIEGQQVSPNGDLQPFLNVSRQPVRAADGTIVQVEAFRDDYVWLVTVTACP